MKTYQERLIDEIDEITEKHPIIPKIIKVLRDIDRQPTYDFDNDTERTHKKYIELQKILNERTH